MFAQHAIACVLCELLCLELFTVFFQHENRFRYKFFDIVQFSRSCLSTSAADSLNILPDLVLNVKHFFRLFLHFLDLYFTFNIMIYRLLLFSFEQNGERGIRTLAPLLTTYSLSRGAPSASLGISPKRPLFNIHDSFFFVQYYFQVLYITHLQD